MAAPASAAQMVAPTPAYSINDIITQLQVARMTDEERAQLLEPLRTQAELLSSGSHGNDLEAGVHQPLRRDVESSLLAAITDYIQFHRYNSLPSPRQCTDPEVAPTSQQNSPVDERKDVPTTEKVHQRNADLEADAVKLLRILKAYAWAPQEISFKGFAWLNIINILLYEDELMAFENKCSTDPMFLMERQNEENLRSLLSGYSIYHWLVRYSYADNALSQYQRALQYDEAGYLNGLKTRVAFEGTAKGLYSGTHATNNHYLQRPANTKRRYNIYDEIMVKRDSKDRIRKLLSKYLPDSWVYTSEEIELLEPIRALYSNGQERNHIGHVKFIETCSRLIFGVFAAVALLTPLVALTFIQNTKWRLFAATTFVLGFVLILTFLTKASNQEMASATAAYAAVLVVFIGSALSSSSRS
jgi:hypothetical protein